MNETKSARYHRSRRRAGALAVAWSAVLLAAMLWWRPSLPLWGYVLLLAVLNELVALPLALYRTFSLDRRYGLSTESLSSWLTDHLKASGLATGAGLVAAELVYAMIRRSPQYWWTGATIAGVAVALLLARLAPVILLPLFYKFTPLNRPELTERLLRLSDRAGVRVLGVYEWALGAKTRRANAALVGAGGTRRILLSDTLLAEYTDDEIEVVLAHELAHHVHGDIPKALALEFVLLAAAFYTAAVALNVSWQPLGLTGPEDVRGLPVVLLAIGAVTLAATPFVYALSRRNERRADRFALSLTAQCDAFVSAMRRLGSQNLLEENPSRTTVWLFHTHPPIEERVAAARVSRNRLGIGN